MLIQPRKPMSLSLHSRQSGLSLIELMIGILIGIVLLGGLTSFFLNTARANAETIRLARLEQGLRANLEFMSRDIRRAGYWSTSASNIGASNYCAVGFYSCDGAGGTPNGTSRFTVDRSGTNHSILYSYDSNNDGTPEAYGFRVVSGVLQYLVGGTWQPMSSANEGTYSLLFPTVTQPPNINIGTSGSLSVRDIRVTLSATVPPGTDNTLSRTLSDIIRVRNDQYTRN